MKWKLTSKQYNLEKQLETALSNRGIKAHSLVVRHLVSIGVTVDELEAFLTPTVNLTHSPQLLKGVPELVDRITVDIAAKKKIKILGDFDCDGVTSSAILKQALTELGADVSVYIPKRSEGYGMRVPATERLHQEGVQVILTCDNGIAANEAIERAKQLGMTVYVTDHHLPKEELPMADVIVNPHQPDCPYPFKGISGAMVVYKFVEALFEKHRKVGAHVKYMPLVAISTIADVMPLRDENRYYVLTGLEMIQKNECSEGVRAILKVLATQQSTVDETTVGFFIGPLLNAPGRMGDATKSYEALVSENKISALVAANVCMSLNVERKQVIEEGFKDIMPQIQDGKLNVLETNVTEGVVGILAGKVSEASATPTLVGRADSKNNQFKGSARSVPGFSLHEAFTTLEKQNPEWFIAWGGHEAAAGFTLVLTHLDEFRTALDDIYQEAFKNGKEASREYIGPVKSAKEVAWIARTSDQLKPFGEGNRSPIYSMTGTVTATSAFGSDKQHIEFKMNDLSFKKFNATYFPKVNVGDSITAYFIIEQGTFGGRKQLNLFLEDIVLSK